MENWIHIRSLLFVPAGKLDKWDKAVLSGSDMFCIDLEDSVPPGEKEMSRFFVKKFLEKNLPEDICVIVRINTPDSAAGAADLEMILSLPNTVQGLMIPKIDGGDSLDKLTQRVMKSGKTLSFFPLIETALALENGRDILSRKCVKGAVFGGHDLAMQLGCSKDWDVLSAYRSQFIRSAGGLNLSLIDMPWFGLDDEKGLRNETENSKRYGFTAKAAIHPAQVKPINELFTPTGGEIAEAREMIRIFEESGGHAVVWKGKVLEPPVINQAMKIIERSKKSGKKAEENEGIP